MAVQPATEGGIAAAPEESRAGLSHRIHKGTSASTGKGWVRAMPWLESAVHRILHDSEPVVGVDITPGHIRVCQMTQQHGRWQLTALASATVEVDQTIHDVRQHESIYVQKLKSLLLEGGITTRYAAIALPVGSSIIRTITTANMADADIENAIALGTFWQNLVQLSVKLKDYSVYYEILERDEVANTMDLLFVASRNADIALYNGILRQAGLEAMVVDVHCFALQNAFRLNTAQTAHTAPTAILKFGADENYILLNDRGRPYLYEVYVSDTERETIHEQLKDPEFSHRFATQVKQVFVKHAAKHAGEPVQSVHVVSLLKSLDGFVDTLAGDLPDFHISQWNPFLHVAIPENLAVRVNAEENHAAWAVPMGLAVRSLNFVDWFHHSDDTDHVNLLPQTEEFIAAQRIGLFSRLGLSVYTVLAVCVCAVLAGMLFHQVQSVKKELKALNNIESEHKAMKKKVDDLRGRTNALQALEVFRDTHLSNQSPLLDTYRNTGAVIPEGVWLNRLQFSPPSTLEMTGRALDDAGILEFIRGLDSSGKFGKVALKTMQAEADPSKPTAAPVKTFNLTSTVAGLKGAEEAAAKAAAEIDAKKKKKKPAAKPAATEKK